MEATIFTGWIYDHLKPHAAAVQACRWTHLLQVCCALSTSPVMSSAPNLFFGLYSYGLDYTGNAFQA